MAQLCPFHSLAFGVGDIMLMINANIGTKHMTQLVTINYVHLVVCTAKAVTMIIHRTVPRMWL